MNIIYLITNTVKLQAAKPPYYYIGSKTNWQGDDTYWGSSCHPEMIQELKDTPDHFEFKVLQEIDLPEDLIAIELDEQLKVEARDNPEYYNLGYATRSNAGYKWMSNSTTELMVPPKKQAYFLNEGYVYGIRSRIGQTPWNKGIKATKERSANMSKAIKGRVPWNKDKTGVQDNYNKPMMRPYYATHNGVTVLVNTVGQNKDMCSRISRQYQTIRYHANQWAAGKTPIPINGYVFKWEP